MPLNIVANGQALPKCSKSVVFLVTWIVSPDLSTSDSGLEERVRMKIDQSGRDVVVSALALDGKPDVLVAGRKCTMISQRATLPSFSSSFLTWILGDHDISRIYVDSSKNVDTIRISGRIGFQWLSKPSTKVRTASTWWVCTRTRLQMVGGGLKVRDGTVAILSQRKGRWGCDAYVGT